MEVEESNRKYHQWLQLQRIWRKQYSVSKALDAAIEQALSPEILFQSGSDMSSIPFTLPLISGTTGTSLVDNFSYILVPDDFLPAIRHCLHMLIISRVKEGLPPAPSAPRSGGNSYRNVRQISFKNRGSYFGTISDLRTINSRVRWLIQQIVNYRNMRKRLAKQDAVILSLAINISETKEMTSIAWTMFDTRQQRVLDQHYVTDHNAGEPEPKNIINDKAPIYTSTKEALNILEKDVAWAVNRDKTLILLAYDIPKCLLILKHQGWSRPWTTTNPEDSTEMLSVREMYEVAFHDLGRRVPLADILQRLQLPSHQLGDTGLQAKYVLQAALELSVRPVPVIEDFGDLSQIITKPSKSPVAELT